MEKISGADVSVLYVDYGNRASVAKSKCVALPGTFAGMAPFAKEYALAMVQLAPDVSLTYKVNLTLLRILRLSL